MTIQDIAISVGQIILMIGPLSILWNRNAKMPWHGSFTVSAVLCAFVGIYFSLSLYSATVITAIAALLWLAVFIWRRT